MREATEITGEGTDFAKYGKLGQYEQYAYILKFKGNKKDQTSLFFSSFDHATYEANVFIEEKMKKISKNFFKQLEEITFIKIKAVGETTDGTFVFESEDIQTIKLGGYKG
jgi:hypothetical protein